jgi:hypothetical protein
LALFGKKKPEPDPEPEDNGESVPNDGTAEDGAKADKKRKKEVQIEYSPEKAAKFFSHAKTVHEATNYEYAMQSWLNGLRWDPSSVTGVESFFRSAAAFLGDKIKKSPSTETRKAVAQPGAGDIGRYLSALLDWGTRPTDPVSAVRATEACAKLGQAEPTYWLGERALRLAAGDKKPRKDLLVKLMESFKLVNAYDKAVEAGEAATRIDPSDGKLAAEVRNLSASATMSQGGYDQAGTEGGFRRNIRDAERQRLQTESEQISKSQETVDRLIAAAEKDYQDRPADLNTAVTLGKRLLERGKPEDEERAYKVYMKAFKESEQFRFREWAGDIKIRRARRVLSRLRDAAEQSPDDQAAGQKYSKARAEFLSLEVEEFQKRVEAYPTDLRQKFELGKRFYELARYDDAIPMFQASQDDARLRIESMSHLARSFERIGYLDEAIHTYRQALKAHHDPNNEAGMALRFGLLTSLQAKAEQDRELAIAEEAESLASEISIQQFNYKDIRERRDALKKLVAELKRGDAA